MSASPPRATPVVDDALVRRLVSAQFPQWAKPPVTAVEPCGWDHRSFRLGERMIVRLPSAAEYAVQVEKEQLWLPRLASFVPFEIPTPLAIGEPADGYPWRWSIYRWIEGHAATMPRIANLTDFARDLGRFLIALHAILPTEGPCPGPDNFHRGGSLRRYDAETRRAVAVLNGTIDAEAATAIWEAALGTAWERSPVWIHGDLCADDLLVQDGRLRAVIDFGMLAVGDPACDLSIAWTLFGGDSRRTFGAILPLGADTWARARGWTLWKSSIVAAGLIETNAVDPEQSLRVLGEVLDDA